MAQAPERKSWIRYHIPRCQDHCESWFAIPFLLRNPIQTNHVVRSPMSSAFKALWLWRHSSQIMLMRILGQPPPPQNIATCPIAREAGFSKPCLYNAPSLRSWDYFAFVLVNREKIAQQNARGRVGYQRSCVFHGFSGSWDGWITIALEC